MPVSTVITSFSYKPGAVMLPEAIRFQYLLPADIAVTHVSALTGLRTVLSRDTAFTVTGDGPSKTGSVRALQVWPADDQFVVGRTTESVQKADVKPHEPVPAKALTEQLDRNIMGIQEAKADASDTQARAIMVPPGEVAVDLPRRALRIGGGLKVLAVDPDNGDIGLQPIGAAYRGDTGPANSTYPNLTALKAADPTNLSFILTTDTGPITYAYVAGDFTGKADDADVVELDTVPLVLGALKRSNAAERVSLRDYVGFTQMVNVPFVGQRLDWTTAFAVAVADLEANPRGGVLDIPMGIFRGRFSLSKQVVDFEKRITVRGAGRGATELWPIQSGDIVVNMVGRNTATIQQLMIKAGDEVQAYAGIVVARTITSDNANNNKFRDLEITGNFFKAPAVSIAAESAEWHNCRFVAGGGSSGVALIVGSDTNAPIVNLAVPGVNNLTPRNANTDIRFTNCEFYSNNVDDAYTVILSALHSAHFDRCSWIAKARSHVHLCDPVGGILGGGTEFDGCHFEGEVTTRFSVDTNGAVIFLKGLVDRNSVDVASGGYLDYDRSMPASVLVLQQCDLRPGCSLSQTRIGLNLHCDVADRTVLDWSNQGAEHAVNIYSIASKSRVIATTLRCWQQSDSVITYLSSPRITPPTTGTYPKAHYVGNAGSSGANDAISLGSPAGWVTLSGGSVDTDPGGMTVTVTAGSAVAVLAAEYGVYEGARILVGDVGTVVVRGVGGDGRTITLNNPVGVSGLKALNYSGAVLGRFSQVGIVGGTQIAAQADSTATTIAGVVADFNAFMAKARAAHQQAT